jgi:hypothetical protein
MNRDTLQHFALFFITLIIVYLSGIYVINMNDLDTLKDGIIVIIFFSTLFPFITYSVRLTRIITSQIVNTATN